MTPGRQRGIRPKNFLFGLLLRSCLSHKLPPASVPTAAAMTTEAIEVGAVSEDCCSMSTKLGGAVALQASSLLKQHACCSLVAVVMRGTPSRSLGGQA